MQIIVNVAKRILNLIRMQKYVSFVIYPTVQNVEINKGHFLWKEVTCQNLSDHLKKKNDEDEDCYGEICKVCDRKFHIKQILFEKNF